MPKPIFYKYFKDMTEVLLSNYNLSKGQSATANLGRNREIFCHDFLSKALPTRLRVGEGEIRDSAGRKTGQLEIIIHLEETPILHYGGANTFPAEGVFAVVEVKSNLTTDKLKEALDSLEKVKNLEVQTSPGLFFATQGESIPERPLRFVFAYEGATLDTLVNSISPQQQDVPDLICILGRGAIIRRGLAIRWNNERNMIAVPGMAAGLAFLHFYITYYHSRLGVRLLSLLKYYEPINEWKEGPLP